MGMILIIAGSRHGRLNASDRSKLDKINAEHNVTRVITGGASGVDAHGAAWARSRGIEVKWYPADRKELGTASIPVRDRKMVEAGDALAVFDGGDNMYQAALNAGLEIFDFRVDLPLPL